MAELPQPPPTPTRSFLQALNSHPSSLLQSLPTFPNLNPITEHEGKIAFILSAKDGDKAASYYRNALIGKFSKGKPRMETLNAAFKTIGFTGRFQLGSIDFRHILIRFQNRDDYQRCWMKGQW